ncbi:MAG: SRPBCC domain-containing protein [Rhodobacteraceae bacterium]|nr:SRPBCC domain-containing protein [Paracoccaceae bacterium]
MTETISKSIYLPAPRKSVWAWLTEPDKLAKWFHAPKTTLQQGEDYALLGKDSGDTLCWGTVEEMRPVDYMRWSFSVRPAPDTPGTVEWVLADVPGGTKLSLTHSKLPAGIDGFGLVLSLDKGWHEHLLSLREGVDAATLAEAVPAA